MKVIVNGAAGRMGAEVLSAVKNGYRGSVLAFAADREDSGFFPIATYSGDADVIIDFSHHSVTKELCNYAVMRKLPVVIATTGQTEEELKIIDDAAKKIPIFRSGNMSVGVALLVELARKAAEAMPDADIEIIERHHNRKEDAPSGTALMIAEEIKSVRRNAVINQGRSGHAKRTPEEIGIHSVRAGNIVGVHEVLICTDTQSITLKHEAYSRALFAEGGIAAAEYLCSVGGKPGIYNMYDILGRK